MHARLTPFALATAISILAACGGGSDAPPPPVPTVDISTVAANDPGSALPAQWHRGGAFMEIYVRGYKDSDGDGIGDLRGLINSLDYLQELGIRGLWLMPVTASYDRDHGYAVSDYRAIEPDYGSMADFEELLEQAHARGIGVIMDYVINHSASSNPLFINARSSPGNPFRNWYIWSSSEPAGWSIYDQNPWYQTNTGYYFAGFWQHMPDWNLRNPDVEAYQNSNLRFWLNKGVDGFRFDAVGNLIENGPQAWESQAENFPYMERVRQLLDGYQQRYMVCESPASPTAFANACGSAFAFGLNYALVNASRGNDESISMVAEYFKTAPANMATLLANHDSFAGARIYDQVGGDMQRYRLLAATYLTLPGIPFIYYGEEIGMGGARGLAGDHNLRAPLSWTADSNTGGFTSGTPFRALAHNVLTHNIASQRGDPNSLFSFYKTLLGLRNAHPALASGSYEHSRADGKMLSFQRRSGDDRVLVVINYGDADRTTVSQLPANATLQPLYPTDASALSADAGGNLTLDLAARSVHLFRF